MSVAVVSRNTLQRVCDAASGGVVYFEFHDAGVTLLSSHAAGGLVLEVEAPSPVSDVVEVVGEGTSVSDVLGQTATPAPQLEVEARPPWTPDEPPVPVEPTPEIAAANEAKVAAQPTPPAVTPPSEA